MNVSNTQDVRKRKVSDTSTSCSSLDNDSDDPESGHYSKIRKVARLESYSRYSKVSSSSEDQASSSRRESSSTSEPDDNCGKCPICLKAFKSQTLGITDTCAHHMFCLWCLEEWSKTRNTCPVDRKEYTSILVLDSRGIVIKQLPIRSTANTNNSIVTVVWPAFEPNFCEVCGLYNNEQEMLNCEQCGLGYHAYCLVPPMESIPTGMWLCNDCYDYFNS